MCVERKKSSLNNLSVFRNRLMRHGKKSQARKILRECFENLRRLSDGSSPMFVVKEAIINTSPAFQVRSCRVGSRIIRVPFPLTKYQRVSHSVRFLCEAARKNVSSCQNDFSASLAREIFEAFNKRGEAVSRATFFNHTGVLQEANVNSRWFLYFLG